MPHSFGVNRRPPEFSHGSFGGGSRVLLVAINSDVLPPIFHQNTALQRTRVVLVPPNQARNVEPANSLPGVFNLPLAPMPRPPAPNGIERPRLVRGEILHDNQGRTYEKIGSTIRQLHKLAAGPQGQVLELLASEPSKAECFAAVAGDSQTDMEQPEGEEAGGRQHQQSDSRSFGRAEQVAAPETDKRQPLAYRKLFADPGQKRVIRLGDFKRMLLPQLEHPERLRDTHWLPCNLQVYEICARQRLESLAGAVLGDPRLAIQFQLLNEPLACRLGLTPFMRPRPHPGIPMTARQPGELFPYDRVLRLQVERDPTAENAVRAARPLAVSGAAKAPPASAGSEVPTPTAGVSLKTSIPERMIKPWEFRVSRDDALYDINVAKPFTGVFTSFAAAFKNLMGGRGRVKKWQLLLSGKNLDDQLWGVRPPAGGLSQRSIREWARKTLEAGGYDPQVMLLEWEIFWRRKGV